MIQGHIFVFFGKEIGTQKGRTPENNTLACARNTYAQPKNFTYLSLFNRPSGCLHSLLNTLQHIGIAD